MTLNAAALPPRAFVESEASAPGFWQIGILWRVLATGLKTGGSLCFLDEVVGKDPGGPVTHSHPQDEGLYLVSGACTFFAGGQTMTVGPGSFVAIPRYTQHAFMAQAGARFLNFYMPAGFEMLLMGVAAPAERNEAPTPADGVKLPPRRLVEKLGADYGQIPGRGVPFVDPPDLEQMATEPLLGAVAMPFKSDRESAPAYWMAGILWSVLAQGSTTDGSYVLFEELCPKDSGAPPHVHVYTDEVFYVLDGEAEFLTGSSRQLVGRGSLVFVPKGTVHAFRVRSETARLLNLYSQAGFERIIDLTGHRTEHRIIPPREFQPGQVPEARRAELFVEIGMQTVDLADPFC